MINAARVVAPLALLLLAAPVSLLAQAPAPSPSPAGEAAAAKDTVKELLERELAVQPGQYTYQPGGRLDPFISLLVNVGPSAQTSRPPGMQGFLIQELALKGIVKDQSGFIALLLGTDGKSYFARIGQRFYDGVLTAMDAATATFRQEVTDPLSPVKTRDVKKSLYSSEEARQ
jgi:type IV pilus assembly protein PilP